MGEAYGSTRRQSRWDPHVDINHDGSIDIYDLALLSKNNTKNLKETSKTVEQNVFLAEGTSTIISVDPEITLVDLIGNNFSIDVNITNANETWAFEFKLGWNASILNITKITNGTFLSQGGEVYCPNNTHYDEGWIMFGCTLLEPATSQLGNGILATINFTTLNEGYTSLHLNDTKLLNNDTLDNYTHETNNGSVFVDQTPPVVTILSPENGKTYSISSVGLIFTVNEVNKQNLWTAYSLDDETNVTSGNTTLFDLSDGTHTITVYARDIVGNEGSDSVDFSVEPCKPNGETCTSGAECCSHACWFGTCSSGYNGGGGGGGAAGASSA
ncbi:MAG: hypothetical protein GTN36_04915 [Candidatus Aenigmarchaeota archaeon]|nr:hypothetical protein [Candidatus Aenigmarchaeota archaeon]